MAAWSGKVSNTLNYGKRGLISNLDIVKARYLAESFRPENPVPRKCFKFFHLWWLYSANSLQAVVGIPGKTNYWESDSPLTLTLLGLGVRINDKGWGGVIRTRTIIQNFGNFFCP